MPAAVLAYLRWLANEDSLRAASVQRWESAARENDLKVARAQEAQLARLASVFWELEGLPNYMVAERLRGPFEVPARCQGIHSAYQSAMSRHGPALEEAYPAISAGMAPDPAQGRMQSFKAVQEDLQRAEAEFGAVCRSYGEPQFYHIRGVLGLPLAPRP
jgi:hypothetical protein